MPHNPLKWLAVFLVYNNALYDDGHETDTTYISMEKQKNSLFNSIEDTLFDEKIKIIIVEVRTTRKRDGIEQKIHVVEKNKLGLDNISKPETLEIDLVTEKSIVQIISFLISRYNAERHIIITFGHGSIVGINLVPVSQESERPKNNHSIRQVTDPSAKDCWVIKAIKYPNRNIAEKANKEGLNKRELTRFFIENKINILSNRELMNAISALFPGNKKLDMLVMYNCLMQNLFTQYELRKHVDFLIAPISGISYPGYNWIDTFNNIGNKADAENSEIANFFIDTIRQERRHRFYPDFKIEVEHTWKINAIQLNENIYDAIQIKFKELMSLMLQLSQNGNDIFKCIRTVKRQLFKYNKFCLPGITIIDLSIFLTYFPEIIQRYASLNGLLESVAALRDSFNGITNHSFEGTQLYEDEFVFVDVNYPDLRKGFGLWIPDKKIPANSVLNIFSEEDNLDVLPSFIEGTQYRNFFSAFTKWNIRNLNI